MFNEYSKLVQDYALLINKGIKTMNDVPDFDNLRSVVSNVIGN